ncbi:MAG: hypothetical protein ACI9MC_003474 [Kiritimatiellia bacterium]|jgi:hypothetical protein
MRSPPLVDLQTETSPAKVLDTFRSCLGTDNCALDGSVGTKEMSLVLRGEDKHVFSPWVSLQAYPGRGGTRLRGRMGPHPKLWTLFVFIYAVWSAVFLSGAVYGYVQLVLGQEPFAFWIALGGVVGQGCACSIDLYGRSKGRKQMHLLHGFLQTALPDAQNVPNSDPMPWEDSA